MNNDTFRTAEVAVDGLILLRVVNVVTISCLLKRITACFCVRFVFFVQPRDRLHVVSEKEPLSLYPSFHFLPRNVRSAKRGIATVSRPSVPLMHRHYRGHLR